MTIFGESASTAPREAARPRSPLPHVFPRAALRAAVAGGALLAAVQSAAQAAPTPAASTPAHAAQHTSQHAARSQPAGAWVPLFDGHGLSAWRGYRRQDVPTGWRAEGNTLAFVPGGDSTAHGDLITRDAYGDFDLEYDWKISPGGNSGVIYRVTETEPATWQTGPEMQILDDAHHADGRLPSHRAGALYDLIAPPPGVARPVGEFNHARIVMRGMHVQQYLNGHLTADLDFASPRGRQLVAASKFHVYPHFATNRTGHIALQDHGEVVAFRNIRIRRLDGGAGAPGDTAAAAGSTR